MRIHNDLPKLFWAKVVNTIAYLINRGPSVPLCCKLPEEEWIGKAVSLSHLKVFDCISYMHINAEKRDKPDAKSRKSFFIGYGTDEFGYKFWNEQDKKVIRNKNIIFNRRTLYKDKNFFDFDSTGELTKENEQVELKRSQRKMLLRGLKKILKMLWHSLNQTHLS